MLLEELARFGLQAAEHRGRHGEPGAGQDGGDIHGLAVDVDDFLARAADAADGDRTQVQLHDGAAPVVVLGEPVAALGLQRLEGADAVVDDLGREGGEARVAHGLDQPAAGVRQDAASECEVARHDLEQLRRFGGFDEAAVAGEVVEADQQLPFSRHAQFCPEGHGGLLAFDASAGGPWSASRRRKSPARMSGSAANSPARRPEPSSPPALTPRTPVPRLPAP
jgi:hypothetical protein